MPHVTIQEIADRLGTSVATVSRALNGRDRVSGATRSRVIREARRLGYRGPGVPTAALLTNELTDYAAQVETSMVRELSVRGWVAETYTAATSARVTERFVDGAVVLVNPADIGIRLEDLEGLPAVLFNWPGGGRFHGVVSDHRESGYLGCRALVAAGHRRIAFVGNPLPEWAIQERLEGARHAMEETGIPWRDDLVFLAPGDDMFATIDAALDARPTAVFALEETITAYAVSAIQGKWGWRIPEDISFLGFHIGAQALPFYPRMTLIRQPLKEMTWKAVEILTLLSETTQGRPETYVFANRLVDGHSIGPPRPG